MIYNQEAAKQANVEELGADTELYRDEPPKVFQYDPSHVPELTTEQMSEIEDAVNAGWDNGDEPAVIQAMVNERLTSLGFNPAEAQDGVLVGKIVGDDGEETRAFVVDAGDFGTRLRNVELHEIVAEPEAVAGEPTDEVSDEKSPEQSAEERRVQEQMADMIVADLFDKVRVTENRMEEDADVRRNGRTVISNFIDRISKMSYALRQGGQIDRGTLQNVINEYADPARRAAQQETPYSNTELRATQELEPALADAMAEARRKLDEAHTEAMSVKLKKVEGMVQELRHNRNAGAFDTETVEQNTLAIISILDQMQYDTHGMETYGHQINARVEALRQAFGESDMRRRTAASTIEGLKRELATGL